MFNKKKDNGLLNRRVFRVLCHIVAGSNPPKTTDLWYRNIDDKKENKYYDVDKIIMDNGRIFGVIYVFTDNIQKITSMFNQGVYSIEEIGHGYSL